MITARYHREIPQRYRLEASKCTRCGRVHFPPRLICQECKNRSFSPVVLHSDGTLVTFTVVRVASDQFSRETPFAVGIVELNDGVRLTAQIAEAHPDQLHIGQTIRLVFRRVQEDGKAGILCYGYKAVTV